MYNKLKSRLQKKAGVGYEFVGSTITPQLVGSIPVVGPVAAVANTAGTVAGLIDTPATEEELVASKNDALSLLPGMGSYKYQKRRTNLSKKLGATKSKPVSEFLGRLLTTLGSGAVGALAGYTIGGNSYLIPEEKELMDSLNADAPEVAAKVDRVRPSRLFGGTLGFAAGALVPGLIGALAAAATKRRTEEEQRAYEHSEKADLANYLLPGAATYNSYKSLGYMMGEDEKRGTDKKKEKKQEKQEKKAYTLQDLSHPDNAPVHKAIGAVTGAGLGGAAGWYGSGMFTDSKAVKLLASILSAGVGGVAGYKIGEGLTDKWVDEKGIVRAMRAVLREDYIKARAIDAKYPSELSKWRNHEKREREHTLLRRESLKELNKAMEQFKDQVAVEELTMDGRWPYSTMTARWKPRPGYRPKASSI